MTHTYEILTQNYVVVSFPMNLQKLAIKNTASVRASLIALKRHKLKSAIAPTTT